MSAVHTILFLATLVGLSWQEHTFSLPPSGCICPGSELTFECSIEGTGATVWRASFITDCHGSSDVTLIHNDRFIQHQTCNDGAIIAQALGADNNTYTSRLTINTTVINLLNGSTVTCVYDDYIDITDAEIIGTWTMIDPPMNLHLEYADEAYLYFGWNSVYPSCPSLHYVVRTTNCGTCPIKVNSTEVVCNDFNVTADIQVCSVAIQRMCGDRIFGIMSDILQVILKVPEAPPFAHKPFYHWTMSENKLMLNITLNKMAAFKISDDIDGSATSYTIQYSDSRSSSSTGCNDTETILASSCRGSICTYTFEITNSSCSPADIIVTAFATNIFGDGPHSSVGVLRLHTSKLQKIYHDTIDTPGILGGVAAVTVSAIMAIITIVVYHCYMSRQSDSDNSYVIEFFVNDEPGQLATALQIFADFKISLDFVSGLASTDRGIDGQLRGFCVSYDCSSRKNEKVIRKLKKTFGETNIVTDTELRRRNSHRRHMVVNFSVQDDFGNIAGVTKTLGDLHADIVGLESGECSNNERQFRIECICSIHGTIIIEKLKKHGVINPIIDSDEVPLPPSADNTEQTIVKFQSDNAVGSYHGVIRALSEIQKFQDEDPEYKLYHVKMSTDGIYLACSYPIGQKEQLKWDIEHALKMTVELMSPPAEQVPEGVQLQSNA